MSKPEFIVAEISKNWERSQFVGFVPQEELLCGRFEQVIEVNRQRGYELHSFQLHRLMTDLDTMNELIIAVFRRSGIVPGTIVRVEDSP